MKLSMVFIWDTGQSNEINIFLKVSIVISTFALAYHGNFLLLFERFVG